MTLDSGKKLEPVMTISSPPLTRQLVRLDFSTWGSSWAERWAKRPSKRDKGTEDGYLLRFVPKHYSLFLFNDEEDKIIYQYYAA